MSKPYKNKIIKSKDSDLKVKSAIAFLTSSNMPEDENFEFVTCAMQAFENIEEARFIIYDNYYDDILEWCEMNEW